MVLYILLLWQYRESIGIGGLVFWTIGFIFLSLLNLFSLMMFIDRWPRLRKIERLKFLLWILLV